MLCALFLLCAAVLSVLPIRGEEAIYDSVIRLHVLAHSDDACDQQHKLAVRDALLPIAAEQLADCTTRDAAAARLQTLLPTLDAAAEQTLRERGCDAPVTVTLGQERYPDRTYDGFCFPAGEYLSLRVMIGEAQGQNWWCVLFPSLCLSAAEGGAQDVEQACVAVGLTPAQYRVITQSDTHTTYRLRFKLLEVFEAWRDGMRDGKAFR